MTFEEQGAYMRLLCKQADSGHMNLDFIKKVLGKSFKKLWPEIEEKFQKDDNGFFFQHRIDMEKDKRRHHSDMQRDRIQKYWDDKKNNDSTVIPRNQNGNTMELPLENRNINRDKDRGKGERERWKPYPKERFELSPDEIHSTKLFIQNTTGVVLAPARLVEFWVAFEINNFNGEKPYETRARCIQHFQNWLKMQELGDGKATGKTETGVIPANLKRI